MNVSGGTFSATSLERLKQHALFDFQIQDDDVCARVHELKEMLEGAKDEPDHFDVLSELVYEIEDAIENSATREVYLLASLTKFTQDMEMLREMDGDAALDPSNITGYESIFARESSTKSRPATASTSTSRSSSRSNSVAKQVTLSTAARSSTSNKAKAPSTAASPKRSPARSPGRSSKQRRHASPKKVNRPALALGVNDDDSSADVTAVDDDDDDVACGVCLARDSAESDPIVICEHCSTAVHQTCYRIAFVPDGDWYCHPCARYLKSQDAAQDVTPTHALECVACRQYGGALVPTRDNAWVHMACSMYLPELYVKRVGEQGEVVCGMDRLAARRRLRCCFCKRTEKGACAQCSFGKCTVSYHVQCALQHGISFAFIEDKGHFGSGCLKHQEKFLAMDGLNADEGDNDAGVSTPSTVPVKERKAKSKPSRVAVPKSKAKAQLWDGDGDDKDEHVLVASDNDEDEHEDEPSERAVGKTAKSKSNSSSRKRQLRLDGVDGNSGPPVKLSKKARQSTVLELAKPSAGAPGALGVGAATSSGASGSASVTQSRVFVPAFDPTGGAAESDRDVEYVMVLIERQPLGLAISTMATPFGSSIVLNATKCWNTVVAEALRRGVIKHLDELFALNDTVLRGLTLPQVNDVIANVAFPLQCWFRTKRRHRSVPSASSTVSSRQQPTLDATAVTTLLDTPQRTDHAFGESASDATVAAATSSTAATTTDKFNAENDALSVDWPWFYLRSDGKIAMNLFWRSLDGAVFVDRMSKRAFAARVDAVETLVGIRLRRDHAEYDRVRELLVMPKRECTPAYIRAFRAARQQKQTFLSSDIFMGVGAESLQADAAAVDEQTPIEVGTVVTVAKRTWAGINKLGGAGRVRRVHEQMDDGDGSGAKRFTYDIAYVLGGSEKKVERKYISVVDLNNKSDKDDSGAAGASAAATSGGAAADTSSSSSSRSAAVTGDYAGAASGDATNDVDATVKMRLSVQVQQSDDETFVAALAALSALNPPPVPTRRVFAFEVSTEGGNVQLTRKDASGAKLLAAAAPNLLLHRHFDVKRSDEDAIVAASFSATLLAADERAADGSDDLVDDDSASDADDDDDEIRAQLETLQRELRPLLASNEVAFEAVAAAVARESASSVHRTRQLEAIQWRHYEQMYRDTVAARAALDASDDDDANESDGAAASSSAGGSDDESGDETFGGLFVNRVKHEGNDVCVLCELSGGDFAATSCGRFVHPQCAMYTPETYFRDGVCHGVADVPPARRSLMCALCRGRQGLSKIQCASKRCTVAYHISCAFVNGLLIQDPHYLAWCPKHLKSSGMMLNIEQPEHLQKAMTTTATATAGDSDGKPQRKRVHHGKQARRELRRSKAGKTARTSSRAGPTASTTTKKRKRKLSACGIDAVDTDDASSADNADGKANDNEDGSERSCARRLDINADSESEVSAAATPKTLASASRLEPVFKVDDVVTILSREWVGSNKPGGVARVRAVHTKSAADGSLQRFYDVAYVLTNRKEKRVEAEYVQAYTAEQTSDASSSTATPGGSRKKSNRGT